MEPKRPWGGRFMWSILHKRGVPKRNTNDKWSWNYWNMLKSVSKCLCSQLGPGKSPKKGLGNVAIRKVVVTVTAEHSPNETKKMRQRKGSLQRHFTFSQITLNPWPLLRVRQEGHGVFLDKKAYALLCRSLLVLLGIIPLWAYTKCYFFSFWLFQLYSF